jgi:hypothetical protein
MDSRQSSIERRGVFSWWVIRHAAPDDGMDTEVGPYLTRRGAQRAQRRGRRILTREESTKRIVQILGTPDA